MRADWDDAQGDAAVCIVRLFAHCLHLPPWPAEVMGSVEFLRMRWGGVELVVGDWLSSATTLTCLALRCGAWGLFGVAAMGRCPQAAAGCLPARFPTSASSFAHALGTQGHHSAHPPH